MIAFIVIGEPVAKGRPRVSFVTKRTYTPEKTVSYENLVKTSFVTKYPDHKLYDSALKVSIELFIGIPKSWSKRKQEW